MKNSIRILHVLGGLNMGGAETMVMNIYRKIDRTKIQFDFVVHTDEKCNYNDEIHSLGGKIYSIPKYNGTNHIEYKKEWNKFLKYHPEYKIIHGHVRSTASIYLRIAKKHGLTTIAHSHSTSSGNGVSAIIKNIMQYPLRYIADYMFACSQSAGEWLFGKRACKRENFYIVNNAIDSTCYRFDKAIRNETRKEFQLDNKYVVGHVGRFHSSKNHEFLINIFKHIYRKDNNSVLMLIGEGEMLSAIKKKVYDLKLTEGVIFTGVRSDIPNLMQAMDVFVFPSLFEGLGVAAIEAQAAGLQCFVSDKIPREAHITNLIESLPLECSAKKWANKILQTKQVKEHRDMSLEIVGAGYDIKQNTKKLTDFYFKIAGVY